MKTLIWRGWRSVDVVRTPFVRQDNSEVSPLDPETQQSIDQSKHLLRQISEDSSVPRNIRRAANEAITVLETETDSPAVRAQNAISILDEPSQDPNCPNHARTKIWHVSSLLEPIRD
ncbi:MAG: hypothetical protein DRP09_04640 [Candidatus Thorarchaeota archaeon]|nr:MAG: hypothetical protein DRP09_04640 [Candidatus Thorarchaeota archaeon]